MSIKNFFSSTLVVLGVLSLAGCDTPEVREAKPVSTDLDFSDLQKSTSDQTGDVPTPLKAPPQPPQSSQSLPTPPTPSPQPTNNKKMYNAAPAMTIDTNKQYTATLKTSAGTIKIDLHAKETPVTVNNFVFLARDHFYDGTIFHRVINNFMIQGGDPQGTGMGGPGYKFANETFSGGYDRGIVAMANAGLDTNGSQFFIMQHDTDLPKNYTVFGNVTSGMDTVDKIAAAPNKPGGEGSTPVNPVTLESVTIDEH